VTVPPSSTFNTHSEFIAAAPAEVWPVFLDRARWNDTFVSRTLVRGPDLAAGAIAEVQSSIAGSPQRREETLFCDPGRRLMLRITATGSNMVAHADFQFHAEAGGCRIDVSLHGFIPDPMPEAFVTQLYEATQRKVVEDYARLRAVVEAAAR